jgi:glutamyl-tRNA reductase
MIETESASSSSFPVCHLVGVSHATLRLDDREKVGKITRDTDTLLKFLRDRITVSGLVVLSTCNRVELVLTSLANSDEIIAAINAFIQINIPASAMYHHVGEEAVRHLFRVASSLDSLVVGEAQILGQVKDAYADACRRNAVDKTLHFVFQFAFRIAKRVRDSTGIAAHGVSISYVAVQLAQQIVGDLSKASVLVLGSGRMAELCTLHFYSRGCRKITIANRTIENAADLARRVHGTAASLGDVGHLIGSADIVVGALTIDSPILFERMIAQRNSGKLLFLIDLGVPRNFQVSLGKLSDVFLYSIDDLSNIIDENKSFREESARDAEVVIEYGVYRFKRWLIKLAQEPGRLSMRALVARACSQVFDEIKDIDQSKIDSLSNRIAHDLLNYFNFSADGSVKLESVLAVLLDDYLWSKLEIS